MKKTLAIILTLVMIFGVVAFNTSAEEATTTPTVSIITNKGSAVEVADTTYVTVKFENFDSIKGVDVDITADETITLGDVEAYGFKGNEDKGVNYKTTANTIRFVDLTLGDNARITFEATVYGETPETDPEINVKGTYALNGKELFDETLPAKGSFEIKRVIAPTDVQGATQENPKTITPANKKFIPQGSVYKKISENEYVFADKNTNGEFIITEEGYQYDSFDIPDNKITTFGASNDLIDSKALRFGSYSEHYKSGVEHGTMIFEGAWLALKNYYIQKGYTVQKIIPAVYKNVLATLDKPENAGKTFVTYNVNGQTVNVYIFEQRNYMWKNDTDGILEYTLRLNGTTSGLTYTAAAFAIEGETVTFTENVKSVTVPQPQEN